MTVELKQQIDELQTKYLQLMNGHADLSFRLNKQYSKMREFEKQIVQPMLSDMSKINDDIGRIDLWLGEQRDQMHVAEKRLEALEASNAISDDGLAENAQAIDNLGRDLSKHYYELRDRIEVLENNLAGETPIQFEKTLIERVETLEAHHARQIDENRKISSRVDENDKQIEGLYATDEVDKSFEHFNWQLDKANERIAKLEEENKTNETFRIAIGKTMCEHDEYFIGFDARIEKLESAQKCNPEKDGAVGANIGFTFLRALKEMSNGKKVRRKGWANLSAYLVKHELDYYLSFKDFMSCDWEIVE